MGSHVSAVCTQHRKRMSVYSTRCCDWNAVGKKRCPAFASASLASLCPLLSVRIARTFARSLTSERAAGAARIAEEKAALDAKIEKVGVIAS